MLLDFTAYPEWNPFIRRISGKAVVGERLEVYIQPPGARGMLFRPTVLSVEANHQFRWLGKLWVRGLFDGEHAFIIEQQDTNRVHFIQQETFSGILVLLLASTLQATQRGFDAMNQALKDRVEKAASRTETA